MDDSLYLRGRTGENDDVVAKAKKTVSDQLIASVIDSSLYELAVTYNYSYRQGVTYRSK